MNTFKAFRVHNEKGVISARFDQVNLDEIGSGNVVILSAYSNINYKDALAVTGAGRIMKRFPLVAGIDDIPNLFNDYIAAISPAAPW